MGNPELDGAPAKAGAATIRFFYSDASWIEGTSVDQLRHVASLDGVRSVAAFPDLHPGKYGPVGAAFLADRIYPHLIGNDIGCGMSLFALDISARKLRLDKAAARLCALEGGWDGDAVARLEAAGLAPDLHSAVLGTIGGGNHFCELQSIAEIMDEEAAAAAGLSHDNALLLVHSGSRSLGASVFDTVIDHIAGLQPDSAIGRTYLDSHNVAVRWASLNRMIIAERAANALRGHCTLVADSPHNIIEAYGGTYLHRKGAAKADQGPVPIAGSRDALSYFVMPSGSKPDALASLAHGSGRKYDRRSMLGRVGSTKSERDNLKRTSFGGHVICDDRNLLLEEAPDAYKDSRIVINELIRADLVSVIAAMEPLVTFKKATVERSSAREEKRARLQQRRRQR